MENYIYMYGQILATNSFVLEGEFPKADGCGNIGESHYHVGGETGTAAAILASFGCEVKLAGTHIGPKNAQKIRTYFTEKNVDISELVYDEEFGGIVDYVFISGNDRTCFGEWAKIYRRTIPWYGPVQEESVKHCSCVAFDPLLDVKDTSVVTLCKKYGKQFATIDCTYDSEFNRNCEVNAISHQFMKETYGKDVDYRELHRRYTEESNGLIIFTFGEGDIMYGRKNQPIKLFHPYHVKVTSTLGAGDSFKAGTVYALSKGMADDEIVRHAAAIAGVACTKYPISDHPPVMEEVKALMNSR